MRLFGIPTLPSGPAAPVVAHLPDLEEQRQLIVRARRNSRRWLVRAVLMLVIGAMAARYGMIAFGLVFFALSLLALQLSRASVKAAAELERRLALLEVK